MVTSRLCYRYARSLQQLTTIDRDVRLFSATTSLSTVSSWTLNNVNNEGNVLTSILDTPCSQRQYVSGGFLWVKTRSLWLLVIYSRPTSVWCHITRWTKTLQHSCQNTNVTQVIQNCQIGYYRLFWIKSIKIFYWIILNYINIIHHISLNKSVLPNCTCLLQQTSLLYYLTNTRININITSPLLLLITAIFIVPCARGCLVCSSLCVGSPLAHYTHIRRSGRDKNGSLNPPCSSVTATIFPRW